MAKRTQGKREELALCNSRRRKAYVAQLVPALKDRKRKCTAGPQAVEERASNRALKAQLDMVAAAPDEFVKMYKEKTGRLIVEAAHMELADPTISDAFDRCVEQGATRIIISPYFLFPGRHWDKDIPSIVAEAAKKHHNVPYLVTAPIGLHELMVTVINDRMEYCLSQVAGEVSECDMCDGTGRCQQSG